MSYTIVGMFPTNEAAITASHELDKAGFEKEDYQVSHYSTSGDYDPDHDYDYEEDEKTTGFWNWLFGDNDEDKKRYSYAGTKSNIVTVYTDDLEKAEKAKSIMNGNGALNVNELTKGRYSKSDIATAGTPLPSDEQARIISKAKNNLYLTQSNRNYNLRTVGMSDPMDAAGVEDDIR